MSHVICVVCHMSYVWCVTCHMCGVLMSLLLLTFGGRLQMEDGALNQLVTKSWTTALGYLEGLDQSLDGGDPSTALILTHAILRYITGKLKQ